MTINILNLYAGIGGNRKLWEDVNVTAVEWEKDIAKVYADYFPDDNVIIADAHEFLLDTFDEFDFIWASPPCPTHSRIRHITTGEDEQNDPVYPDMRLYEEILFLDGYYDGNWVVENVKSWYSPLVEPLERHRHYLWSNFYVPDIELEAQNNQNGKVDEWEEQLGFDLSSYNFNYNRKQKILRNCVHPQLGKHVLNSATNKRQATLGETTNAE